MTQFNGAKISQWCTEIEAIIDDIRKEVGEADNMKRNVEITIMEPTKS